MGTMNATEWPVRASIYHADPAISATMMCDLMDGVAQYYGIHITKELAKDPTAAMAFGTAVHAMVLEPDMAWVWAPEGPARKKVDKANRELERELADGHRAEYESLGRDYIEIKPSDFGLARLCANTALENPAYATLREGRQATEWTVKYTCPWTGIDRRARLDEVGTFNDGQPYVWDLKTARDPSPSGFARAVADLRYHNRMASYRQARALYLGCEPEDVACFVTPVRNKAPWETATYQLFPDDLNRADAQNRVAIEALARLIEEAADGDPGLVYRDPWTKESEYLELPAWTFPKDDWSA